MRISASYSSLSSKIFEVLNATVVTVLLSTMLLSLSPLLAPSAHADSQVIASGTDVEVQLAIFDQSPLQAQRAEVAIFEAASEQMFEQVDRAFAVELEESVARKVEVLGGV
mgnify:CR=1 FL=1